MTRRAARNLAIAFIVMAIFSIGGAAFGQQVSKALHPNLAAAQDLILRAVNKLTAAQKANEFDLNGHAAKARALLDQVYAEIKLAAEAANARK